MAISEFIRSMRPSQWTKNVIVFAGILFSGNPLNMHLLLRSSIAFAIFCLLSGSWYILNDLTDRKQDIRHPLKSKKPMSHGTLSPIQGKTLIPILIIFNYG